MLACYTVSFFSSQARLSLQVTGSAGSRIFRIDLANASRFCFPIVSSSDLHVFLTLLHADVVPNGMYQLKNIFINDSKGNSKIGLLARQSTLWITQAWVSMRYTDQNKPLRKLG